MDLLSYINSANFGAVGEQLDLHHARMEQDWVLVFSRKFAAFFGAENQPLTGTFLFVNLHSRKFFISVFGKTHSSGVLDGVEHVTALCYEMFGNQTRLPCLGYNALNKGSVTFSSSKFSENCSIFCQNGSQSVCEWCAIPQSDPEAHLDFQIKTERIPTDISNEQFFLEAEPDLSRESKACPEEAPKVDPDGELGASENEADLEFVPEATYRPSNSSLKERCYVIVREFQDMFESLTCTLCPEALTLPSLVKFHRHLGKEHEVECLQCARCDLKFKSMERVTRHAKNSHFYGQFNCLACAKVSKARGKAACFSFAADLVDHMLERHFYQGEDNNFDIQCPKCKQVLKIPIGQESEIHLTTHYVQCLKDHEKKIGNASAKKCIELFSKGIGGYTCETCGMRFRTRERLNFHVIRKHTKEYPFVCDECPFKTVNKGFLVEHKKMHEFKQLKSLGVYVQGHVCEICGKECPTKISLSRHMNHTHYLEHMEKKGFCQPCCDGFDSEGDLKSHLKEHHSHVHFNATKCEFCGRITSTLPKLERQHRFHCRGSGGKKPRLTSKEKFDAYRKTPKTCKLCGLTVTNLHQLTKHNALVHSTDEKHQCQICGFRGMTQEVERHMVKHKDPEINCEICGKLFKKPKSLKAHLNMHNGVTPYKCDLCDMAYTSKSSLFTHKSLKHKKKEGEWSSNATTMNVAS